MVHIRFDIGARVPRLHRRCAGATTYRVSVAVEQNTYDDFKTLTDWLKAAQPDDAVPAGISRRGTAAMAEIVAAAEKRSTETNWLTLDSGTAVVLADGDTLEVAGYVANVPATAGVVPLVVIVKGQGFAVTMGRKDLMVPSRL